MSSRYRSRFVHSIGPRTGRYCLLYHALTQDTIIVDAECLDAILGVPVGAPYECDLSAAVIPRFTAPTVLSDEEHLDLLRRAYDSQSTIHTLYLLLTNRCNLACMYCSSLPSGSSTCHPSSAQTMSEDLAEQSILAFQQLLSPHVCHPSLIFYGGEPLLASAALRRAIDVWNRNIVPQHPNASATLITNGTLLSSDSLETIKQGRVRVSVSLDGPAHVHDHMRRTIANHPSFSAAWDGYQRLLAADVPTSISCTLTDEVLSRFKEVVDWLIEDAKPAGIGFNVIRCRPDLAHPSAYFARCTAAIQYAHLRLSRAGIYEDRAMRKVSSFVERRPHTVDCSGLGQQLAVRWDGTIGPCHVAVQNHEHCIGRVDTSPSIEIDYKALREWSEYAPILDDACSCCPALSTCGGGCRYSVMVSGGGPKERDPHFCEDARKWVDWMGTQLLEYANEDCASHSAGVLR